MSQLSPMINYYVRQAGTGLHGYEGIRYQRGHGFFGSALKFLMPALKTVGKAVLNTGANVASDVLQNNVPIAQATKRRLIETGQGIATKACEDGIGWLGQQAGRGRKRRRKSVKRHQNTIKRASKKSSPRRKRRKIQTLF